MDKDIKIYTKENIIELLKVPVLNDDQIYIYVLLSSNGNIKIGKTKNIVQRVKSLSGSNNGGYKITHIYCSPTSTWMQSVEGTCHNHFHYCRIPNTEWFDGNKTTFEEVVEFVDKLFKSDDFKKCNEIRRQFIMNRCNDLKDKKDGEY